MNMEQVQRILQLLNERGLTQSQLAEASGLALGTVNRIIKGKQKLMPNTLDKIARALNVEPYTLSEYNPTPAPINEVSGYLEYSGEITKIRTLEDVEQWVSSVKHAKAQSVSSTAPRRGGIIGSIIGDIVGSRFEFSKKVPSNIKKLFGSSSTFTDDTVLTVAIADSLTNHKAFNDTLWEWGQAYPNAGWGHSFKQWLKGSKDVQNNSEGNGAAMRVSPVGYFAKSLQETLDLARQSAETTHNTTEGIKGAQAVAASVFLARQGKTKDEIRKYLESTFGYNLSLSIEDTHLFVESVKKGERQLAKNTVPVALISFLKSKDYEQTIRTAISFGIDTDTVACIAGGIAAAFYGVPHELVQEAVNYLPAEMLAVINVFDGSSLNNNRIMPTMVMRWRKDCVVVYGTNADDSLGEDGYADTHPSNFNHHPLLGYPIHTIGANVEDVKKEIKDFIDTAKTHPETTYLVSKVGLGKSGLGVEVIAPLFKSACGLDNVYLPKEIVEAVRL